MLRLVYYTGFLILAINTLFSAKLFSQDFIDLVSTGTNFIPKNKYENSDKDFQFISTHFNIQYPHVFKNKDIFLTKLSFNHYNWRDDSVTNMYITYLQFGFQKNLNDKLSLKFSVSPKMANQLQDVSERDFVIPCMALFQIKKSDNFSYGFGLFYSREMFGNFMFPLINAKWKINSSWYFYADFPVYGYLMYYPKEKFKTGIYISTSTNSIRLSDKYNSCYVQKAYADFSLFFDYYFTKHVVLRLKGGYSIMRSLDMYNKDDTVPLTFSAFKFNDKRVQLNDDIKNAPFIELSLIYRYHY